MLLSMSRTKPPEELNLGSKLSQNCDLSHVQTRFCAVHREHMYTLWCANQEVLQHLQECVYHESTVYIYVICILWNSSGTEISDLNLSLACSKTQTVISFETFGAPIFWSHLAALARAAALCACMPIIDLSVDALMCQKPCRNCYHFSLPWHIYLPTRTTMYALLAKTLAAILGLVLIL